MIFNEDITALDIDINGYGNNHYIDLQEAFFEMKLCDYSQSFIDDFLIFAFKFNNVQSLVEVEEKCMHSMSKLFRFCCSLGEEGFALSTNISYVKQLALKIDHKVGFLQVFSKVPDDLE